MTLIYKSYDIGRSNTDVSRYMLSNIHAPISRREKNFAEYTSANIKHAYLYTNQRQYVNEIAELSFRRLHAKEKGSNIIAIMIHLLVPRCVI